MIDLLLILTSASKLKEFLLFCPLSCLRSHVAIFVDDRVVVKSVGVSGRFILHHIIWHGFALRHIIFVVWHLVECVAIVKIVIALGYVWTLDWLCLLSEFFLGKLLFLFFDQLLDEFLFINLLLHNSGILTTFFAHYKHRLMVSILDELILDVLIHHVESVFDIVLSSTRHFFYDLRPFVSNGQSFF